MFDALCEFNAKTGFVQSDEITLVFVKPDVEKGHNHIYSGRVQKITSLVSSFISVTFNNYFRAFVLGFVKMVSGQQIYSDNTLQKISNGCAYFDARILSWDEEHKYEMMNHMIWRSTYDCYRNSIQSYAHHAFGHKKINGKNGTEMIKMLEEKGIVWGNVALHHKYGIYLKNS